MFNYTNLYSYKLCSTSYFRDILEKIYMQRSFFEAVSFVEYGQYGKKERLILNDFAETKAFNIHQLINQSWKVIC